MWSACGLLAVTDIPIGEAAGLVTAAPVVARDAVPPFANTAMDGFAVRAADTTGAPVKLRIVGTVAAGATTDRTLATGEAIRIMTGASIPAGADAIVMVERTRVEDGEIVVVEETVEPGQFIRPAGDDIEAGRTAFDAGTVLTAAHLGVLASLGHSTVPARRARVAVLSTGDELVDPPAPLGPGQIRDSNRPGLLAVVRAAGCIAVDLGIVADTEEAITTALDAAIAGHDAVITTGGVSMGDFDYVKRYLPEAMQVAIKPAKPFAFGVVAGTPVFGLPGNPVSSMVSFELFARPALRRMMGDPNPDRPIVQAVADEPLNRRRDGKLHLVRVVVEWRDGAYHLRSAGGQGSHQLTGMAAANGLALLADGDGVAAKDLTDVMLVS